MARERRLLPARLGRLQPLRRPRSPPRSASTRAIANELDDRDGRLAGTVARPIVGAEAKRQALLDAAAARQIPLDEALAVGDGANDIPMLKAAGLGIAYHAKPAAVAAAADAPDRGRTT